MTDKPNEYGADVANERTNHNSPDPSEAAADTPEDEAVDPMARIEELEQTVAALTKRLLEVESTPQRDSVSRRSLLGLLGAGGLIGLGTGSATADPQGQIGTETDPLRALYTMNVRSPGDQLQFYAGGTYTGEIVFDGNAPDVSLGATNSVSSPSAGRTVSGGSVNRANGEHATVSGGSSSEATGEYATVSGGTDNLASGFISTIGGGASHEVSEHYTTVGGGTENVASFEAATVAGGASNSATGGGAAIGGGRYNQANGYQSTVAGGGHPSNESEGNTAYTNYSTVGGGRNNEAGTSGGINADVAATVSGGEDNSATADYATVPGGAGNTASAPYAFAAGKNATARNEGSFVWCDTSDGGLSSVQPNEFVVSANGGTYFFSNEAATTGVQLSPGSGSWSSASSRALKSDIEGVSGEAVLDSVTDLDISRWSYDSQDGVRHMGPMAEEFHETFELGADEESISTVDADGVALGAIQGLAERGERRDEKVASQEDRLETLEQENEALRERLAALEAQTEDTSAD